MSSVNGIRYFEDLSPGQVFDIGTYPPLTEADIIDFARQWDPQYFHVDPEAAKDSIFEGLVASGWHTGAILMRLLVDNFLSSAATEGSPGLEQVRFLRPVRPGDQLRGTYEVLETQPSASRPNLGKVRTKIQLFNRAGEAVLLVESWGFFTRRGSAPTTSSDRH